MTDTELHDELIHKLADGRFRSARDDDRLRRFARWIAREYYEKRVQRHFICTGALKNRTDRRPEQALQSRDAAGLFETAILGSRDFAEQIAVVVTAFLRSDDDSIVGAIPYWRELIRYDAALFRVGSTRSSVLPEHD